MKTKLEYKDEVKMKIDLIIYFL